MKFVPALISCYIQSCVYDWLNFANFYSQTERIQYDRCNASAGSGQYTLNGFCPREGSTLFLTLTENSQNLMDTVNFENNNLYYFASKHFCVTWMYVTIIFSWESSPLRFAPSFSSGNLPSQFMV